VFIVDRNFILDCSVFSPFLVVSTSEIDCLERLTHSKMAYIVTSGMLNSTTTTSTSTSTTNATATTTTLWAIKKVQVLFLG